MGHCTLYYYTVHKGQKLTKVSSLIWQERSSTATTAGGNWVPPAAQAYKGEVLGPRQEALQVGNDYMPEGKKAQFPCHMILGNK